VARFVLTAQLQLQGPSNVRQVVNEIQRQLRGVSVDVTLKGGPQAQRQLREITDQSNKAATAASSMGKALGISIRRFTGLAIATRAVSLFTNTLGAAVKESIAFERELIKISQVTGKTVSQLKDLTNTITSLATGLGVSSTSLLQTSRILSQAGLSARETEIALKALAKTELAPTFDNIGNTAEGAVAIFNQFRQGAEALEGQLGSLNAVAGKFAVESGDLISVIRRTGGVFKAAGGDLNQLVALFTSVRSTTRESAESIATGLRTILTRIQRPRTIEYLRQYGVELETLEGKFVGPFEAIRRLSEATAGLEQGDLRFIEIAEEIAGFRQIGKVIPLLREFRVSQEALAVAQAGVNSLTDDAAKAQLSLAVRIIKVKEEFLSLVRSITETTSFQVMASVVLTLAESLIRLGEAIKPILPLLSALVAFRAIKGIGGFLGNIPKGFANARGFASGGMVPGTGNRDTVPAMLTPGEFVIKKSSVAKLGANNLAAMNENRYAAGGIVTSGRHAYGRTTTTSSLLRAADPNRVRALRSMYPDIDNMDTNQVSNLLAGGTLRDRQRGEEKTQIRGAKLFKSFGVSFLEGSAPIQATIKEVLKRSNITGQQKLQAAIQASGKTVKDSAKIVTTGEASTLQPNASKIFDETLISKIPGLFDEVAKRFNVPLAPISATNQQLFSKGALNAIRGNFFEAFLKRVTNNIKQDDIQDKSDPIFDIKSSPAISKLQEMFGGKFVLPNELKVTASRENVASAVGKAIAESNPSQLKLFAKGGSVGSGTDTVPALLTPGEFVINRSSAKSIGYSNLNRMNQVGKYAAGGIVSHNRHAYGNAPATMGAPGSIPGMGAGPALERVADAGEIASSRLQQISIGLSIALSTLQGFVPAVEKGSSASVKLANSLLSLGLQASVAFSLFESFGKPIKRGISALDNFSSGLGKGVVGLAAVAASTFAVISVFRSLEDKSRELADAIQEGKVAQAGAFAGQQFDMGSRDIASGLGGAVGGAIGFAFGGPIGAAIGAAGAAAIARAIPPDLMAPLNELFTGQTKDASIALAQAHAQATDTAKVMTEEQTKMNEALQKGNLIRARQSAEKESLAVSKQLQALDKAINEQQKIQERNRGFDLENDISGGMFADFGGFRSRAISRSEAEEKKLVAQRNKAEEQLLKAQTPRLQEEIRVIAARQGTSATPESVEAELIKNLKTGSAGDQILAKAIERQGLGELGNSIKPLTLAVQEAQKQFEALNLGLNPVLSSTGAAIVGLDNLANNLNENSAPLANSVNTLEAATTNAAAGISSQDFEKALNESSDALRQFGADEDTIKKARTNAKLFTSVQKEFPSVLERVKEDLGGESGIRATATSGDLREKFAKSIQSQLQSQGFSEDEARRVGRSIEQGDLTKEQQKRIQTGDVSVFSDLLADASKKAMNPLIEATKQAAEVQKKLIPFIQKRIEAENKLIQAQQQAIDIAMEARDYEAQFGGAPVTTAERRQAVAARSNVLGRAAGLSDVGTDVASFRRRREEIRAGFSATQLAPGQQQTPENAAQADRLKQAQQDQVKSLRDLIKIQQDEIKTIQEKQRLEKESLDSLLAGDIDKFFEQQAAQGAIAAAATGNAQLMGAFGADATGAAAKELQRLQAAGVTEIYGQQIGGAGGLAETTALAGFRQRGLSGQSAVRAAQIQAGTTEEQLQAEAVGRQLSAELAAAGDLGTDIASDELATAGKMLQEAARRITEAIAQERGGRQRGETTGKILAQDKVIKKQEGVVDTKKQELVAVQDAQKKVEEENTKKAEQYGRWVDYANKVKQEGGQLSKEEQEMMSEVIEEKRKLAQESAEADRKVVEAKVAVKKEEDKLLQEQNKKQKMVQSLDASGQRILPDATPAPSSASSSVGVSSTSVASAGVGGLFNLGRQVAGDIGEAEGRRRGENSFFGLGGFFGGGDIGASRGREAGQAQFDNIFGGLDEQSTETLNNFANSVQSLQGMEVAHKLGDMNINLGGVDFLANMQPEIRNTVIDELQKQLDNYRPSSAGMRQNKGVLPTA